MTGHIRRRGKQSWELKFDIGVDPTTSKRRIRYCSFKGTKRAAELELARLISEHADGSGVDPSKVTVAEFFDRWDRDFAAVHVSPKTRERYSQLAMKQIIPNIGSMQLQKVRPVHLNSLYAKLLQDGLAARTVGHVHRLLHRALGHAGTWGIIRENVAAMSQAPKVDAEEVVILSDEQIAGLRQRVAGRSIAPIIATALATGVRRGELLALRLKDFDEKAQTLRIERSVEQTKAGLRIKPPKTRNGKRTISLPPFAVSELRAHVLRLQERRLAIGIGRASGNDLLFPTWDGHLRSPNQLSQKFRLALQSIGVQGCLTRSTRSRGYGADCGKLHGSSHD
jgi:integrase